MKTVQYWHKNKNTDQWNKIERPEINHVPIGTLFLTKETRIYSGGKIVFNKWHWENWTATCERMKLEHSLTLETKINSKWTTD